MSRSAIQYKSNALPVYLQFLRMLQSAVVAILFLFLVTSNGLYRWVLCAISVSHIVPFCTFRNSQESSCLFETPFRLHLVHRKRG